MPNDAKEADRVLRAYHTLGVSPGHGLKEVKQAYRALARALHPDRTPDALPLMARINEAYGVLNDYFKANRGSESKSLFMPISRLGRGIGLHLASWFGQDKNKISKAEEREAIELPEALSQEAHWVLRGIAQEEGKLVYQVEIDGNPKALALPLRRRRPCRVCQGSGNIWEQGKNTPCNNCGGRGYITKPASLTLALPERWVSGQRLAVASPSFNTPLEVELHRATREIISTRV